MSNFLKIKNGVNLKANSPTSTEVGDLFLNQSDNQIYIKDVNGLTKISTENQINFI